MTVATDRELFWADAVARSLDPGRRHTLRDSKTPSGTIPIGHLRGPIITDVLYRTMRALGLDVRFVYTIDDYDPMDSQTMRLREDTREHMGKPFANIPSPEPAVAADWAEYHATRFVARFAGLGIHPEFHRMRDLYRSGELDRAIELCLRGAATIRAIHQRVARVEHPEGWLPISVICERCGRIGTTLVTDFDGATVAYHCRRDYVEWAEGCGLQGRVSPFKGNSKLLWNEQWCAQWDHFDVTYEEGGKDLLTAGGSRERSNAIYREVFGKEPPPGLMHEFFTLGGKKMSTSHGIGAAAHELASLYPGELVRFLMLRIHPKRAVEFDPGGMSLPRLYDDYDRCAAAHREDPESDFGKIWALSQLGTEPQPIGFVVRFALLADWLQIPSIDPQGEARRRKGSPLAEREERELRRRLDLARLWLERWAPDEARFSVSPTLPPAVADLGPAQRAYLRLVAAEIGRTTDADALQERLYDLAREAGLVTPEGKPAREAFAAIYIAFIGQPNGPRAGWLLTSLDPDLVRRRLEDAAGAR